jgi:hypothetical protein
MKSYKRVSAFVEAEVKGSSSLITYLTDEWLTCANIQLIQAINNSWFDEAKSTLEVIHRLIPNTHVPDNYFSGVVETGRHVVIRAIKTSQFDDANLALDVIQRLTYLSNMR